MVRSTIQRRRYRRNARPSCVRPNAILLMRSRSVRCPAVAIAFATHRCRRLCRRSPAPVFAADGPHDDVDLRGSSRAFLPRADFRRGCRTKVVSQRNTRAVDHHHPLRPLAPLGFSDSVAPFFAGAKLPSRNDSLHFSCWRSFNSLRNARQIASQTPCLSQSRSRRQHVEGCGYFSGRSCQRAPLRRIHRIPSRTRRFRSTDGHRGAAGAVWEARARFSATALRQQRTDRAIDPPSARGTYVCPLCLVQTSTSKVISEACPRLCNSF